MVGFHLNADGGDSGHAFKIVEGTVQQERDIAHPAQIFLCLPGSATRPLQLELKSLDRGENCHSDDMPPLRVGWDL